MTTDIYLSIFFIVLSFHIQGPYGMRVFHIFETWWFLKIRLVEHIKEKIFNDWHFSIY